MLLEAQSRLGGRAYTAHWNGLRPRSRLASCGFRLHSADKNPWVAIAAESGFAIDKTRLGLWSRPSNPIGFPVGEQKLFQKALGEFYERADEAHLEGRERRCPISLDPDNRWNPLINAISMAISVARNRNWCQRKISRTTRTRTSIGAPLMATGRLSRRTRKTSM